MHVNAFTKPQSNVNCYIGLGSNLEDPYNQVTTALAELKTIAATQLLSHSSLYRSEPVGPPGQPDYVNAIACLSTSLTPMQLLHALQAIEQAHQRVRIEKWGPRTLDLDIILYADWQINHPELTIPHPYAGERSFVLWPLAEIAPKHLSLPGLATLDTLLLANPENGLQRIENN